MFAYIRKKKKWALYGLYAALLTGLLLYLRFPSEEVRRYIEEKVNGPAGPFAVSVRRVSFSPPWGLTLAGTVLFEKQNPEKVVMPAQDVRVVPGLLSLFGGKIDCLVEAKAFGGTIESRIALPRMESKSKAPLQINTELNGLDLGSCDYIHEVCKRKVDGDLRGSITYHGPLGSLEQGEGEADLLMEDLVFAYLNLGELIRLDDVAFKNVKTRITLKKNRIEVTELAFSGRELGGNLSGHINLNGDILSSGINLRGSIRPSADLLKKIAAAPDAERLIRSRLENGTFRISVYGSMIEPRLELL